MKYRLLLLIAIAMMGLGYGPAWADWQEIADRQSGDSSAVEDNPAWDEYAFDLDYADGSAKLTFHELARTEKPFVLFFWLTDCPVCHLQLPYVKLFDDAVRKHGLEIRIVAVNLDDSPKAPLEMFKEKNLRFDLLIDPHARRTDKSFNLRDTGTPVAFIFDGAGLLVESFDGFHSDLGYQTLTLLQMEIPEELDKP